MPEDKIKHPNLDADSALFRESIGNVRRLKSDKHVFSPSKPKPIKKHFSQTAEHELLVSHIDPPVEGHESSFYAQTGLNHKTIRRLKRGDFHINSILDLHGMTQAIAQPAIIEFINQQVELAQRYTIIVHGKGMGSGNKHPVLKNLTLNILTAHPKVLAYTSAQEKDGGTGALYILMAKPN